MQITLAALFPFTIDMSQNLREGLTRDVENVRRENVTRALRELAGS